MAWSRVVEVLQCCGDLFYAQRACFLSDLDERGLVEGFSQSEVLESRIAEGVDQFEGPEGIETVLDSLGEH